MTSDTTGKKLLNPLILIPAVMILAVVVFFFMSGKTNDPAKQVGMAPVPAASSGGAANAPGGTTATPSDTAKSPY